MSGGGFLETPSMVATLPSPSLFDPPRSAARSALKLSIQERFERWIQDNPRVWELFKRFAEDRLRAGFTKYSADAILARVRWEVSLPDTVREGGFKLNDHYTSRLARKLQAEDERFKDFFELRQLQRD